MFGRELKQIVTSNVQPLEVVSRYRYPQHQVIKNFNKSI